MALAETFAGARPVPFGAGSDDVYLAVPPTGAAVERTLTIAGPRTATPSDDAD